MKKRPYEHVATAAEVGKGMLGKQKIQMVEPGKGGTRNPKKYWGR